MTGKLLKVGLVALVAYVAASILFPKTFGEITEKSVNALKNSGIATEIKDVTASIVDDCKNLLEEENAGTLENNNSFATPPVNENVGTTTAGEAIENSAEELADSNLISELDEFTAGILDDCRDAIENSTEDNN